MGAHTRTFALAAIGILLMVTTPEPSNAQFGQFFGAKCVDAGIRCRIPVADVATTTTTSSGSGSATGGFTGDVPTATIGGSVMYAATTGDNANFFVVGQTTVRQCYDATDGGCQPNHCPVNIGDACNKDIGMCKADDGTKLCEGTKISG